MATLSTNIPTDPSAILRRVGRGFARLGNAILSYSERDHRVRAFNALMAKSDAELAEMGLRRDQVGQRIFGDLFYV